MFLSLGMAKIKARLWSKIPPSTSRVSTRISHHNKQYIKQCCLKQYDFYCQFVCMLQIKTLHGIHFPSTYKVQYTAIFQHFSIFRHINLPLHPHLLTQSLRMLKTFGASRNHQYSLEVF